MSTMYQRNRATAWEKPVSALYLVVLEKDWIREGTMPPDLQRWLFAVAREHLKFPQERVQVELPQPPPSERKPIPAPESMHGAGDGQGGSDYPDPHPRPPPRPPPHSEHPPKKAMDPKPTPEVMGVIRQQKAALQQAQRSVEDALEACALILDE